MLGAVLGAGMIGDTGSGHHIVGYRGVNLYASVVSLDTNSIIKG